MEKQVYSLCFMCSVRCPIQVTVRDGVVTSIEGNHKVAGIEGSLCARGAAGIALLNDPQRATSPMIREGARGEGRWRSVGWDEALDYVAGRLKGIIERHGGESVAFAERTQLATHVSKAFAKAIGSPNHFTHDALCKGSVNTACRSLFGLTDNDMGMDFKNTRHLVLYGRNIFEALAVKEVRSLMDALDRGAKLTCIDSRVTVTATKAHRYWMIRPGTDLALNYALINVILAERLYDPAFVARWVEGLAELQEFVRPFTPAWAQGETGIPADEIVSLARETSAAKPGVIFHFGYRGASHANEIHFRRSIMILNALMGSIEVKGGFFFKKGPGASGGKPPRKLTDQAFPPCTRPRCDGARTAAFPLADPAHGVPQHLIHAILHDDPYPLKALIAYRFEPLQSIPDTQQTRRALDKLELVVAIDVRYSDIAWYADVILPESMYLERTDCLQQMNGLVPQLFLRRQAVPPRHDTREIAMILKQLAERLGVGQYFPYSSMEELVRWQLEGTGFALEDFDAKGCVSYAAQQIFWDRADGLKLKTPSGKIEFKSSLLEKAGFPSFPAYAPVERPEGDRFRLTVGRNALHTHVSTQNNPYLNEFMPENVLWIHTRRAAALGIGSGDTVQVTSPCGSGTIRAFVSDLIHPDAVFMVHGFGHESAGAARAHGKGLSDSLLQQNISDTIGGSPALHDTFVTVRPLAR